MQIIGKISNIRLRTTRKLLEKFRTTRKFSANIRRNGISIRKLSSEKIKSVNLHKSVKTDFLGIKRYTYNHRYFASQRDGTINNTYTEAETTNDNDNCVENDTIGQPRQVLVLHLPRHSKIGKHNNKTPFPTKPTTVAALIAAESISGNRLKGNTEVAKITTVDFNHLEPNKVMLVPIVLYESDQPVKVDNNSNPNTNIEHIENDKDEKDNTVISSTTEELFTFPSEEAHPNTIPIEFGDEAEKVPISTLNLKLRMQTPNVEKILENYMLSREDQHLDQSEENSQAKSIDENPAMTMLSDIKMAQEDVNNYEDISANSTLPLDFKAEINGILGINLKNLDSKSIEKLRATDFNSLISTVTGNIASVAIQNSCKRLKNGRRSGQRKYSTKAKPPSDKDGSTRNSPSELFQTYRTRMKKKTYRVAIIGNKQRAWRNRTSVPEKPTKEIPSLSSTPKVSQLKKSSFEPNKTLELTENVSSLDIGSSNKSESHYELKSSRPEEILYSVEPKTKVEEPTAKYTTPDNFIGDSESLEGVQSNILSGVSKEGEMKSNSEDEVSETPKKENKAVDERDSQQEKEEMDWSKFHDESHYELKSSRPEGILYSVDPNTKLEEPTAKYSTPDYFMGDSQSLEGVQSNILSGVSRRGKKKSNPEDEACEASKKKNKAVNEKKSQQKKEKVDCSKFHDAGKGNKEKSPPKGDKLDSSTKSKKSDTAKKEESTIQCNDSLRNPKNKKKDKGKPDCSSILEKEGPKKDKKVTKGDEKVAKISCSLPEDKNKNTGDKKRSEIGRSLPEDKKGKTGDKQKSKLGKDGVTKKDSKLDCSDFTKTKEGSGKKDASKKDSKDVSKKGSTVDCSSFGKEKKTDKKSDISKKGKNESDKKSTSKKDPKTDCSNFTKGKESSEKKNGKKDTKGGKKDSTKKDNQTDCSAFTKGKDKGDKKDKNKSKSESKMDCSGFAKKKDGDEKKNVDKKDSKVDCSAFLKDKGGKTDDTKRESPTKGKGNKAGDKKGKDSPKKDAKIDCSTFTKAKDGNEKKNADKKDTKIDCSSFTKDKSGGDKKQPSKKDSKTQGATKKDSKTDCSSFTKGKGNDKKDSTKIGSKNDSKKDSKIDCSSFTKGKDRKDTSKKDSKIDCSSFTKGKEGSDKKGTAKKSSKIDCSTSKEEKKGGDKKDESKKGSNIDCSSFKKDGTDKKKSSKTDSKMDCSQFSKGSDKNNSSREKKDSGSKKDLPMDCTTLIKTGVDKKAAITDTFNKGKDEGNKKDECAVQSVKIDLSKDVHIEVTNAQVNKKSLSALQMLSNKSAVLDGSAINCLPLAYVDDKNKKLDEQKNYKDDPVGSITVEIEGPASLCIKSSEKSVGDRVDVKSSPFEDGDKKYFSSIAGKGFTMLIRTGRIRYKRVPVKNAKELLKKNPSLLNSLQKGNAIDNSVRSVPPSLAMNANAKKSNGNKLHSFKEGDKKHFSSDARKILKMRIGRKKTVCKVWPPKEFKMDTVTLHIKNPAGYYKPKTLLPKPNNIKNDPVGTTPLTQDPSSFGNTSNSKEGNEKAYSDFSPFKTGDKKFFSSNAGNTERTVIRSKKRKYKISNPDVLKGEQVESQEPSPPKENELYYPGVDIISPKSTAVESLQVMPAVLDRSDIILMSDQAKPDQHTTNKVVKIPDCKEVCLENRPLPKVGDYDALIKVHSVGLSGSDLYMYETGAKSSEIVTLGHEASGTVEEIGKCVTHLNVGDRVAVEPGVPCGICDFCKRGAYNLCQDTIFNGSLAEYCVHPADFCHKLPRGCNIEDGALMHSLSLALHACNKACVDVRSNVLIIGACPLGLSAIMCCQAMGATHIAIVDELEKNLQVAEELCVDKAILLRDDMTDKEVSQCILSKLDRPGPPNIVINCSGCTKSLNVSIMTLRPGGVCVLAGCQAECANFNILETLMKEITIKSSFRTCNMFPLAISLLESCKANVCHLITHRFPLSEVKQAFETALDDQNCEAVKVLVRCHEEESSSNDYTEKKESEP